MSFRDGWPKCSSSSWSELRKRYFQQRYLCSWILAALFPFLVLRIVFFYNAGFPFASPVVSTPSVRSKSLTYRHPRFPYRSPGFPRDQMSPIAPEPPPLIRPDEDAWITHDAWINNHNPEVGRRKKGRIPERSTAKEPRLPFSPNSSEGEIFGVPEDNDKEDAMTWPVVDEEDKEKAEDEKTPTKKTAVEDNEEAEEELTRPEEVEGKEALRNRKDANQKQDVEAIEAEEKRKAEYRKNSEERAGEERKVNDEKMAAEEREAEEKMKAEDRKRAEESAAEQRKGNDEKMAVEEREAEEEKWKAEDQKSANEDTQAEERKANEEKKIDEDTQAEERKVNSDKEGAEEREAEEKVKAVEKTSGSDDNDTKEKKSDSRPAEIVTNSTDTSDGTSTAGDCDLFEGVWEYDPEGPLYTNGSCFYMQSAQDCMSNGRPDTEYQHLKWKPRDCDLPRFDARAFLVAFQNKTIGFVGDSLSRNQMQSLLCMLSQVEIPIQTYQASDDRTVRWLYQQHGVSLGAVWSPYLLQESGEGVMGFAKGQSVLHLDVLDTEWTSVLSDFDIVVLSIGQWYYKGSVYIRENQVIGCHYCPGLNLTDVSFFEAYRSGLRLVLEKVAREFKGIAIMSTFAIAHFEHGPWDKGGDCRRQKPLKAEEVSLVEGSHNEMHDIVMDVFNSISRDKSKLNENVRLEFLDVTKVSLLRADGHPGPYRSRNPFQGKDPNLWVPNDCLHWCLPGPVDTWNQLLVKIVHRYL